MYADVDIAINFVIIMCPSRNFTVDPNRQIISNNGMKREKMGKVLK